MRGQPGIAAYSAAKGALERWAESMAGEIAPFGLGVTVLVAGTYDTDIITDAGTTDERDFDGPYARLHRTIDKRGRFAVGSLARPPERFAAGLMRALDDRAPFRRRGGGRRRVDAVGFQPVSARRRYASGEPPRHGNPAPGRDAWGCVPLTAAQRLMVGAARVLPPAALARIASMTTKRTAAEENTRDA